MISCEMGELHPSAKVLVKNKIASRIHRKDASMYDFSEAAAQCARDFMGWTDLASNPPYDLAKIQKFADEVIADGITTVILIGQGGSTQAPMTITKYNKLDLNRVEFRTIDSDSPVRVRQILSLAKPQNTLVITSSKSGGTIEPRLMLCAVRAYLQESMSADEVVKHLVAITDPGSALEKQAIDEGWRAVFPGEPTVGGRFSALSVFGLLPAALVGIDLNNFVEHAAAAERQCSEDAIDNPAIGLASFLYGNYKDGRDKFCFFTPKRGRVLGLWIEQLVAESVGKEGKGILPNIEVDSLLLTQDPGDCTAIMYQTKNDLWDEQKNFEMSLAYIDRHIPHLNFRIESVEEVAEHFVMWEYAIAMLGYLLKVCPFDQPDVAVAKAKVLEILNNGAPDYDYCVDNIGGLKMGTVEIRVSESLKSQLAEDEELSVNEALAALFASINQTDYFCVNAFLPYTGEYRREALEVIRHRVARSCHVASCLEVGPRYLHSTGQLHKGGPNKGVFLILSADELKDIPLPQEADSLGSLAKAQAIGDWMTLSERGRRCVHLHLPDNTGVTLRALSQLVQVVLAEQCHECS